MNTRRLLILGLVGLAFSSLARSATGTGATGLAQTSTNAIDLPTALRLAGADNLDVKLAREKVGEAEAAHEGTRQRFFPWVAPAITAQRHRGNAQAVNGPILDADKQSLALGVTLAAQLDFGETYYQNLAAKQLVRASESMFATRQRETVFLAALAYFDLARARAAVTAAVEAARVADNYARQISAAAESGVAFKGDAFRVRAAHERSELLVRQLRSSQRIAAARLAQLLHLDPVVELVPADDNLAPLTLVVAGADLGPLVAHALAVRPDLDGARARLEAARVTLRGATYGPLVPRLGAQASVGGLGGGPGSSPFDRDLGRTEDYLLGLSWRIGPGGLLDGSRKHSAQIGERIGTLELEKVTEEIRRQVVEQHAHLQSLSEQLTFSRRTLEAAGETARLSRERQQFGIGAVLEDLQAEDELARARRDYFAITAEFNKAQYALRYVTGD